MRSSYALFILCCACVHGIIRQTLRRIVVQFCTMNIINTIASGLRKGPLNPGRVLLLTRFAAGKQVPVNTVNGDEMAAAAGEILLESKRLETVAYALACAARDHQGVSERALVSAMKSNRGTLRSRLGSKRVVELSEALWTVFVAEGVVSER